MYSKKRNLLFLVNAHAGKEAIRTPFLSVMNTFVKAGYQPTVYITQRSGELPELTAREAGEYDLVVCSGGDGTLNETINGLMRLEHPPVLGYIPAGTTNDFAMSLCLPHNIETAAKVAVTGTTIAVDVGRFGEDSFSYVAAFGAFTDVPYATSQEAKNMLGKLAYALEVAQRLGNLPSYRIRLEHDGGVIEDEILIGLVSNSSSVAGFPLGKWIDISMNDGLLEVTLIRKPPMLIELTRVINTLLIGELDEELIYSVKTKKLRITCDTPIPWTLDGEYGGSRRAVDIENVHQALRINVPAEQLEMKKLKGILHD